jgi:sugar phosphate isomerase/epimerase
MYTRRDFGKAALAALPASQLLARPNSNFGGVQIGVIAPYSFRGLPGDAHSLLNNIVALGLSAVELQSPPVEAFAGAPVGLGPPAGRGPGAGGPGGPGGGQQRARGRRELTPEEQAERRAAAEALTQWRLSAPMDKFKELRKKYENAGVAIQLVKFGLGPDTSDDEVDYCFQVAKALGCRGITCEPPLSATKRLGQFAQKHKILLAYHGHANVTDPEAFAKPESWEQAFSYSKYNGANIDIGHFTAGNSKSPAEFIRKYHGRIPNLHLKDRKIDQGANMPWGEGDTPIKEILQMVQKEKWNMMGTIELEYPVPEGSNVMTELAKCVEYCNNALT